MNAKIYKDGNRIIVSFEGIEDAENILDRIVRLLSEKVNNVTTEVVPDLEPPMECEENFNDYVNDESVEVKEPEIEDFEGNFAGQTPQEILKAPKCEGFYFLCTAIRNKKIPPHYTDEVKKMLADFIEKKGVLKPPYGDVKRMQNYCKMAQNMLGENEIPDYAYTCDDEQWLNATCRTTCEVIQEFCNKYLWC